MIKAGVMGDPVSHSLSPMLHGYWLKKYGILGGYEPLHVLPEGLTDALATLRAHGYAGVNLTLPHKEAALKLMEVLSPEAKAIGAVNTVIIQEDGTHYGHNTDAYGFIQNLVQSVGDLSPYLRHAVVLGAGGAARAILYGLLEAGAEKITITNRTREKADALAKHFGARCEVADWAQKEELLAEASLLVNTTALGMAGKQPLELSLKHLPTTALVTDIVYTPLRTQLLKDAKTRGNVSVEGLGMLLHQAAPGFEAWFGVKPEVDAGLEETLKGAL